MQDFRQILQRLADSGLEFVIVGGYAAVTYGSSLVTRDLDICMALSNETVQKLRGILAQWNPKHRMTPDQHLRTDVGDIDILSSILGVGDFGRLKEKAENFEIDGRVYHVISLEDLIVSKEAMGWEKDLLAAKELKAIAAERKKQKDRRQ